MGAAEDMVVAEERRTSCQSPGAQTAEIAHDSDPSHPTRRFEAGATQLRFSVTVIVCVPRIGRLRQPEPALR
eukprot:13316954-Alexandrium_andersonii.AAC.1